MHIYTNVKLSVSDNKESILIVGFCTLAAEDGGKMTVNFQISFFTLQFDFSRSCSNAVVSVILRNIRCANRTNKFDLRTLFQPLWLLRFNSQEGEHMSSKITAYDKLLVKRVEAYRKVRGLTQAGMAEASGQTIERYKRCLYFEAKPYAEPIATLSVNLGVSLDELMLGKNDEYMKVINFIRTCPMSQLGEIFKVLSERCMQLSAPKDKGCDYLIEDGTMIESIRSSSSNSNI